MAFILAIAAFFIECGAVHVRICIATSITGDLGGC